MDGKLLFFAIAVLLFFYFTATGFTVGAFDITLIVSALMVGVAAWIFYKGFSGK